MNLFTSSLALTSKCCGHMAGPVAEHDTHGLLGLPFSQAVSVVPSFCKACINKGSVLGTLDKKKSTTSWWHDLPLRLAVTRANGEAVQHVRMALVRLQRIFVVRARTLPLVLLRFR